ncbi:MAG: transporter substrate-binding domain-containing protein [Burkholderiaceae bacterium]
MLLFSCALAAGFAPRPAQAAPQDTGQPVCTRLIASGNPQYPPYLWRDPGDPNRLIGANAELMQRLSTELQLPIELRYVGPWARVQEEVRAGHVDLIAGAFWTLPRTEYMDYFQPAFQQTQSLIWVREGARLDYRRWEDLIGLQGVTVINNSFGEEFDSFARAHLKIGQVASLEQAFQMLQRARADYLIYEDAPGLAYLARMNIGGLRMLSPAVARESLYLTLSHRSACNSGEMRGRISRALSKLLRGDSMRALVQKNLQLWRGQNGS